MSEVGIRALKQNASAVVAEAAGETVTIPDRGRAVAQLTAIPKSRLSGALTEMRTSERN